MVPFAASTAGRHARRAPRSLSRREANMRTVAGFLLAERYSVGGSSNGTAAYAALLCARRWVLRTERTVPRASPYRLRNPIREVSHAAQDVLGRAAEPGRAP